MSKLDVVRDWSDANDLTSSDKYLSDDFQFIDPSGQLTMGKQEYIGFASLIFAAMPDIKYVRSDIHEEGDYVIVSGHFEGTFENDLDLSAMGLGVIPASGKKVAWKESTERYVVKGDKIVKSEPIAGAGGFEEFLAPLGVKMPQS